MGFNGHLHMGRNCIYNTWNIGEITEMKKKENIIIEEKIQVIQFPVSRREWFAAMASEQDVKCAITWMEISGQVTGEGPKTVSIARFICADAMIEASKK